MAMPEGGIPFQKWQSLAPKRSLQHAASLCKAHSYRPWRGLSRADTTVLAVELTALQMGNTLLEETSISSYRCLSSSHAQSSIVF